MLGFPILYQKGMRIVIFNLSGFYYILGGSWVVIGRVVSRVATIMTHIRGLITPLITTHEPPSRV